MAADLDPATVAVVRGYLEATSREMGVALTRNAASPIFIEGQDFSCALLDARRDLVAAANYDPSHLCSMAFAADWAVIEIGAEIGDDDVIALNDPYRGGTHLPDVTMFSPLHVDGLLVAYVVTRAHHLDIGGMAPGSVPSGARDVFAEGLRIPPVYWQRAGEEVAQTVDWIMSNVRLPEVELSDFRAQVASLRTGQERLRELCDRYGVATVTASMDALKDQSERHMRAFISSIPDGVYRGSDLMDGDGNTPYRYEIRAAITVAGDQATIDFSGSSLQAEGSINLPFASTASAVYSGIIPLAGSEIAFNHGCFRPLRFVAPRGSIVNAQPPAPTFGCTTDGPLHVIEAMLDALAHAIPDRVIAGSYATCNVVAGSGTGDDGDPFLFWFFYEGGWGATSRRDGWNCTPNQSANFCDYPVEIIESVYPVRCDAIELLAGSGGAGRHRGGPGHRPRVHVSHADEPERVRRPPRAAPGRAPRRRGRRPEPLPAAPRRRRGLGGRRGHRRQPEQVLEPDHGARRQPARRERRRWRVRSARRPRSRRARDRPRRRCRDRDAARRSSGGDRRGGAGAGPGRPPGGTRPRHRRAARAVRVPRRVSPAGRPAAVPVPPRARARILARHQPRDLDAAALSPARRARGRAVQEVTHGCWSIPSSSTISDVAVAMRSAFASAYSGECQKARARSADGNSSSTSRFGSHSPSSTSAAPPRVR